MNYIFIFILDTFHYVVMSIIQNQHEYQRLPTHPTNLFIPGNVKNQEHYSIISTLGLLHYFI